MSRTRNFDQTSLDAIDTYFRQERQRSELIRQALGPSYELEKQMKALQGSFASVSALHKSGALVQADRIMKAHQDQFKGLKALMTPQWISAIHETARAVSQNSHITDNLHALTASFETGIVGTAKAMQSQNAVLASAMAAAKWQSQFKTLSEQIYPNLTAFGATAQRALLTELTTLRASAGQTKATAAQIIAEKSVEAHQIAQAFAISESPEESAKLLVAFVAILASIFERFKENTVDELRKMGLVSILLIALTITALPQLQDASTLSSEEQQAYAELHSKIDVMQAVIGDILAAENEINEVFVSDLPQGILKRVSNIRSLPRKDGALLSRGKAGEAVAVLRSESNWTLVVYRDLLTNQLSQGWIYGDAIEALSAAEPDFEAQMAAAREVMARRKRALRELAK